ncbi:pseudouridine synthase [Novosphingobium aquiterrae]|uniref:pseudouridine synthase n=1 Tax=Novosphingobium aquiterrae TaxID=624388 RepID=UPI00406BC47E
MNSPVDKPRAGDRIAKLLARAGVASRREVERMIEDGRIKIGDVVVTTPATLLTSLKGVSVDGTPVKAPEAARLFLFHKPAGLLTAERDPAGRPTIYTALRNALPADARRVMPIGRLDFNTEGLLLLTNDGGLKRTMELPATGLPRTYRARTFGAVTQDQLDALIEGVEIEGVRYGKINANMERSTGRNQWIEVTITEGKNREVRRVLEYLGLEVSRLIRTAYGPFELLDLPRGAAVEVRQVEVERFVRTLKVPGSAPGPEAPRDADSMARARVQRARRDAQRPAMPDKAEGRAGAKPGKRPLPRKPREDGKLIDRPKRPASGKPGARPPGGSRSGPRKPGPRK